MDKKLLLIELNEFNFDFIKKGIKKYNCPNIKRLFEKKNIKTYTNDALQDYNLDPWVQWVSVHTGKTSAKHKIHRHGETLRKDIDQIWDKLSKKKICCSIWNPVNGVYRNNKRIKIFFPDPWSFKENPKPKKLQSFLKLPRYYSMNYTDINYTKIIKYFFEFLTPLIFSKSFFNLLKLMPSILPILIKQGLKNYILFFLIDLINLLVFKNEIKKNFTSFNLIFINSLAHFQHNNWDKKEIEYIYFFFVEKIAKIINQLSKNHNDIIICNGFSQEKIKPEYIVRNTNPLEFIKSIGIKCKTVKPNMTTGGTIYFNNKYEKNDAKKKLTRLSFFGINIINVEEKKNHIFYDINLRFKKTFSKDLRIYRTSEILKNIITKKKIRKIRINRDKINFSYNLFKKFTLIKTTSKHINTGNFFYSDFGKKLPGNIANHKIFDLISDYYLN